MLLEQLSKEHNVELLAWPARSVQAIMHGSMYARSDQRWRAAATACWLQPQVGSSRSFLGPTWVPLPRQQHTYVASAVKKRHCCVVGVGS
jgi:hypothetical protein